MPRFVILEHDHPVLHWDLMLEAGTILRTWRLAEMPAPGKTIAATATFDHRLAYLDYEGPVSGNRGSVKRWLTGTYETLAESADRLVIVCLTIDRQWKLSIKHLADQDWIAEVLAD